MKTNMIKRWTCNTASILYLPILILILFAVGFGMAVTLIAIAEADTWFAMGVLMAGMAPAVMCPIFYSMTYSQEFSLALSFGSTRQEFFLGYLVRQICLLAVSYGLVFLLGWLETLLYPLIFPGIPKEPGFTPVDIFLDPRVLAAQFVFSLVLPMFCGSLIARFGKAVWTGLYLVFLVCCFGLPRLLEHSAVLAWVVSVPLPLWYVLGGAAVSAMLVTAWLLSRKQRVQ